MNRVHRAQMSKLPDVPQEHNSKIPLLSHQGCKLQFQGHPYQIYSDLAQSTIVKNRVLKRLLQILQAQYIKYWWGFPFKL